MWVVILLFVIGVVAAFPLAIGLCSLAGWLLPTIEWWTTRCPTCQGKRRMQMTDGIRGKGDFYLCHRCGQRAFWSIHDRAWEDASHPDFDRAFQGPIEA